MKTVFVLFLLTIAQTPEVEKIRLIDGRLGIQKVLDFPGKSQKTLYLKSLSWIKDNFKNPDEVTDFKDPELGSIKVRYVTKYKWGGVNLDFRNTIFLDVKDGKARFTMSETEAYQGGWPIEKTAIKKDGSIAPIARKAVDGMEADANTLLNSYALHLADTSEW